MTPMAQGNRALALFFALALAVSAVSHAAAAPGVHRISDDTPFIEALQSAWRLDDPNGEWGPQEAAAARQRGEARPLSVVGVRDYGVGSRRAVWLGFDVLAEEQGSWILEIGRTEIRRVRVFTRAPGGEWVDLGEQGDELPFSARPVPHRNYQYPVKLPAGTTSFLVRTHTEGPTEIQATLWQPVALQEREIAFVGFSWLFFGICGSLLVYNLLLFVMVRDRGYLLYVAGIAAAILGYLGRTGLAAQYIVGDATWWNGKFLALAWSSAAYFRVALARHFLSTRERLPWGDKVLVGIAWLAIATCIAAVATPRSIAGGMLIFLIVGSSLFLDVVSVIALLRRFPGAVYYCASWMTLSTGVVIAVGRYFTLFPTNVFTTNSLPLFSALSYIVLSIALAHQINEEKRQKEKAQAHTLAIMRASQALGAESRLDRLHTRLRQIMSALTGATHVHLVLWDPDNKDWFLQEGDAGKRVPLDDAGRRNVLPASLVRHVANLQEPLMIPDVAADDRFAADPAFEGAPHSSLLALPIDQHGAERAVLLLENRSGGRAFSPSDIETLASIAGPLAVSIENILLYERLEQRVAEQTRELRETQQQLVTMARRAGMAEIATNVLHNMGNILNSVNVDADLLRSRLHESKLDGVSRAAVLMEEHAGDLAGFMASNKGRLLPGYLRELGTTLARERDDMLERVGRLLASVDHIKNVVATQQAHAGSSVFTERLVPGELVDEALRITGDSLQRHGIAVTTEVETLPPALLDKTRALQILVNLITNARQALDGVGEEARALHVRMRENNGTLEFRVRDEGCGIAPENLSRIFSHGFTTRAGGHGFGLHSSALAAGEMGGKLTVHSDGPGHGATFTLELPLKRA